MLLGHLLEWINALLKCVGQSWLYMCLYMYNDNECDSTSSPKYIYKINK